MDNLTFKYEKYQESVKEDEMKIYCVQVETRQIHWQVLPWWVERGL